MQRVFTIVRCGQRMNVLQVRCLGFGGESMGIPCCGSKCSALSSLKCVSNAGTVQVSVRPGRSNICLPPAPEQRSLVSSVSIDCCLWPLIGEGLSCFRPADNKLWSKPLHRAPSRVSCTTQSSSSSQFHSSSISDRGRAEVDKVLSGSVCPGCGVEMQSENPKAPGFFQLPIQLLERLEKDDEDDPSKDNVILVDDSQSEDHFSEDEFSDDENEEILASKERSRRRTIRQVKDDIGPTPDNRYELAGLPRKFWNTQGGLNESSKASQSLLRKQESMPVEDGEKLVVCARCHALRNYGQVKDESIENLLPDFDFEQVVGTRLRKAIGRRAVVVMVIDALDFDGSFPALVAKLLAESEENIGLAWQVGASGNVPRLVIALNKIDLLPSQISPVRLEQWVRRRSRAGGVTQLSGVHVVSAFRGWGIDKLAKQVTEMAGPRGDVWVIGAQNAGKSSLINALAKYTDDGKTRKAQLTEAAVPGTTLGILTLEGILPHRARVLDTPGLLHPHQITTRLTRQEQKMVQIRKILKPRTFRVKVGHSIAVAGLMRLDVVRAPAESIYATVWASPFLICHMGRTDKSRELFEKHVGDKLQPPMTKERLVELGRWVVRTVKVTGDQWGKSSVDVTIAGLGWIGLALSGPATLDVWTYEGVAVTTRDALVYDLAPVFERPGFTAIKLVKGEKLGKGDNSSSTDRSKQRAQRV